MLWVEHSSSIGWRSMGCRHSTLAQTWRIAGYFDQVVWTPWWCHCMWLLLVAIDRGKWCMIRWGVRPGIVISLEHCARAWRSVGVGGEHYAWWIKGAWLPAMKVAATLAIKVVWANAVVGMVVGWILGARGIIHNPVRMHLLPHRIIQPRCVMVHSILVKRTSQCHAHGNNLYGQWRKYIRIIWIHRLYKIIYYMIHTY